MTLVLATLLLVRPPGCATASAAEPHAHEAGVSTAGQPARGARPVELRVHPDQRIGTSALGLGVTHTQYSLDSWGSPDAIARAKVLLGEAVTYQNQHIYGWGVGNPSPAPGRYDWTSLDVRIATIESMRAIPVITLAGAPDWITL